LKGCQNVGTSKCTPETNVCEIGRFPGGIGKCIDDISMCAVAGCTLDKYCCSGVCLKVAEAHGKCVKGIDGDVCKQLKDNKDTCERPSECKVPLKGSTDSAIGICEVCKL